MNFNVCYNKLCTIGRKTDQEALFGALKKDLFIDGALVLKSDEMLRGLSRSKATDETGVEFDFATMLNPPIPFVWSASSRFPDLAFNLFFAQKDWNISGHFQFYGGEPIRAVIGCFGEIYDGVQPFAKIKNSI